jgi:hypothetical protein
MSSGVAARIRHRAERLIEMSSRLRRPGGGTARGRRIALVASVVLFAGGIVIAYRALPEVNRTLEWLPIVLVAVLGVPALMLLNAAEYAASARVVGQRPRPVEALRVAIVARAANLLPIPGAVLVRSHALKTAGSTYGHAFGVTAVIGLLWFAVGALLAGLWQIPDGVWQAGIPVAAVGLGLIPVGHLLLRRIGGEDYSVGTTMTILVIEAGMILVKAVRLHLILGALDVDPAFSASVALSLSGVLASALGFFPAGLGVRELFAAAIGPLVDVAAAPALLASGIDRLVALPILAVVAVGLALAARREPEAESEPEAP